DVNEMICSVVGMISAIKRIIAIKDLVFCNFFYSLILTNIGIKKAIYIIYGKYKTLSPDKYVTCKQKQ
ncbi:MAG: hypothetical protein LBQ98_10150, partial [Nitrososphaerota archaeon]|nr:hypothetical protein [Nitrososphaerota archaeon]